MFVTECLENLTTMRESSTPQNLWEKVIQVNIKDIFFFKYFKYFVKNIPLFATLSTRKSNMTRCQMLIHPLLHQSNQFGENNFVT